MFWLVELEEKIIPKEPASNAIDTNVDSSVPKMFQKKEPDVNLGRFLRPKSSAGYRQSRSLHVLNEFTFPTETSNQTSRHGNTFELNLKLIQQIDSFKW